MKFIYPSQSFEFCLPVFTSDNNAERVEEVEVSSESISTWTRSLTMNELKAVKPDSTRDLMQLDVLNGIERKHRPQSTLTQNANTNQTVGR